MGTGVLGDMAVSLRLWPTHRSGHNHPHAWEESIVFPNEWFVCETIINFALEYTHVPKEREEIL